MRLSIFMFGLSNLTVRIPVLIGGFLYIFSAFRITVLIADGQILRWALFVCLVYNPFTMDYLVAARGYGLALGFLCLALYIFAGAVIRPDADAPTERESISRATGISICGGLTVCANYSFGYAAAFTMLVSAAFLAQTFRRQRAGIQAWGRLAAAFALPAMTVLLVLAGSALTRFPRDQLFWGSNSMKESWKDVSHACWDDLNPNLVNPLLAQLFGFFQRHLFQGVAIVGGLHLLLIAGRPVKESSSKSRLRLAGALAAILALTSLTHWLQFKLFKIPLPYERTALWFVPLATAFVGTMLAIAAFHRLASVVRGCGIAILLTSGLYFVGSLRDAFFQEWRDDSEVNLAFPTVIELCRRLGVREVPADQNLATSLNFYRDVYQVRDVDEFPNFDKLPPGRPIYVLWDPPYADFIKQEGLQVVWRGHTSKLVVAVKPGLVK